jgi:hypothetical protein
MRLSLVPLLVSGWIGSLACTAHVSTVQADTLQPRYAHPTFRR